MKNFHELVDRLERIEAMLMRIVAMPAQESPTDLSISEVSRITGLSERTIYQKRHEYPFSEAYKIGKKLRFPRSLIDSYIESEKNKSQS
jgi:excisionase family DNA binding protein